MFLYKVIQFAYGIENINKVVKSSISKFRDKLYFNMFHTFESTLDI